MLCGVNTVSLLIPPPFCAVSAYIMKPRWEKSKKRYVTWMLRFVSLTFYGDGNLYEKKHKYNGGGVGLQTYSKKQRGGSIG